MSDTGETAGMVEIRVVQDELQLGELADFEDTAGVTFEEAFPAGGGRPSTRSLIAFLWMMRRRDDPGYTLDDARRISLGELNRIRIVFDDDDGADPTPAPSGGAEPTTG